MSNNARAFQGIEDNIAEYRRSCELLVGRIDTLTLEINHLVQTGESTGTLVERRARLYGQLVDLQGIQRMLREYSASTARRCCPPNHTA